MLLDLQPGTVQQGELAPQDDAALDRSRRMTAMDGLKLEHRISRCGSGARDPYGKLSMVEDIA